jgi:predicted house-cleaning noncanonical NTP pyrophosphatase (MazG superfamily)
MKKALKSKRPNKIHVDVFYGEEPSWEDQDELKPDELNSKLGRAYNWYNYMLDKRSLKPAVVKYLKSIKTNKKTISLISSLDEYRFHTVAATCKMIENGLDIERLPDTKEWLDDQLSGFKSLGAQKKKEKVQATPNSAKVISIQDRVRDVANEHIAELEEELDNFVNGKFKSEFSMYDWLQRSEIKPMIASKISDYYVPVLDEAKLAISREDDQINEGYKWMTKKQRGQLCDFLTMIVEDARTFGTNKRKVQAPRKKKPMSVQQVIKKVQYMEEEPSLKIASVDPAKVIGSSELWAYNTKYRALFHYVALDRGGLTFSGTSLKNYDEALSKHKTLRDPEKSLNQILSGGPKAIIKRFNELTTKTKTCNGRLNNATVLLRVIQ